MLLLFAFSITPKRLLHGLLANHKDTPLKCSTNANEQVNVAGFNCGCDDLVVESPFLENPVVTEMTVPLIFFQHDNPGIKSFVSFNKFYFELRGPPSLA